MKQFIFLLTALLSFSSFAQITGGGTTTNYDVFLTQRDKDDNSEFKKIAHKMYLTTAYLPSKVDGINETFYLRYNIFRDEMEFTKGDEIVYLKKEAGRKVTFTGLNTKYNTLEMNGKLRYFIVHNEGKNTLLSRLIVTYLEPKEAKSSYEVGKPADFKRRKDELYIAFNNVDPVKVPSKKKDFYTLFGSKSSDIKGYMKKNKLGTKKVKDLEKIVNYFNTL